MGTVACTGADGPAGDGRRFLDLSCRIQTPDFDCAATVVDLSFDGAGIEMPAEMVRDDGSRIWHIDIEGLGGFDAIFRWKIEDRVGVSFKSPAEMRARLEPFFAEKGIAPQDGDTARC